MLSTVYKYIKGKLAEHKQRRLGESHKCMFLKKDVLNLAVVPRCTICGKPLPE